MMKKERFTKTQAIILIIGLFGFFIYPIVIKRYDFVSYFEGFIYFSTFSIIFVLLSNYKDVKKSVNLSEQESENLDKLLNSEEEFIKVFTSKSSFYDFKKKSIENKIIDETGKYVYSERVRDTYVLVAKIKEQGLFQLDNDIKICKTASSFFQKEVSNGRMGEIYRALIRGEELSKNDERAYKSFSFISDIEI